MYRVVNVISGVVLSLDQIDSVDEAIEIAAEIESHESQPETEIQENIDGEWVRDTDATRRLGSFGE